MDEVAVDAVTLVISACDTSVLLVVSRFIRRAAVIDETMKPEKSIAFDRCV